jgi:putative endonuclease
VNTREKGNDKELLAAEYLSKRGMCITERNFRSRQGEIDIIGYEGGYLVFVEVKYRAGETKGNALAAVNITKQKKNMQNGGLLPLHTSCRGRCINQI